MTRMQPPKVSVLFIWGSGGGVEVDCSPKVSMVNEPLTISGLGMKFEIFKKPEIGRFFIK